MPIRTKVFVIMCTLFALLGAVEFLIQRFIIYPSFLDLERREAGENLQRIFHAVDREIVHLHGLCGDWAQWDDSHAFIDKQSDDFTAKNLNQETLALNRLNLLVFARIDGTVVWRHAFDYSREKPLDFAFLAAGTIAGDHPLLVERTSAELGKVRAGVLDTDFGPLLFSTREILHSDGSGPGNGWLVMGRFLDEAMRKTLSEQTRIAFDIIHPLVGGASPCEVENAQAVQLEDLRYTTARDGAFIKTCAVYQGSAAQPIFGVRYLMPSEVTRKGIASIRYAAALMIASGVVILVILSISLQHVILLPLKRLTEHAVKLQHAHDYSLRLALDRNDEIGALANSLDAMVETINQRTGELKNANQQLLLMSMQDGLTGIANRRAFDLSMHKEYRRAMRSREPLSVILLDVDFFKRFNDAYGHLKGDHCLMAVASTLQQQIHRPADMVARYGGEEFVIVLPNTPPEGAMLLAERARVAVQHLQIDHSVSTISPWVSISLGVVTMVPEVEAGSEGLAAMLDRADQALYQAKQQGRDRVVFASS